MTRAKEQWREIPGYEGIYQASNQGRIRSSARIDSNGRTRNETLLAIRMRPSGQAYVNLFNDGKLHTFEVATLVAMAFGVPNPDPSINDCVARLDGNLHNCDPNNLYWTTKLARKQARGRSSNYWGVSLDKVGSRRYWLARVRHANEYVYIGRFSSEIMAAAAYDRYVISHQLDKPLNNITSSIIQANTYIPTHIPDLPGEMWASLPGLENCYQVSNRGRVKSLARKSANGRQLDNMLLKTKQDSKGQPFVILNRRPVKIAQLATAAFASPTANDDHPANVKSSVRKRRLWEAPVTAFRGVTYLQGKGPKRWSASISLYGREITLGRFNTAAAAAKAYDAYIEWLGLPLEKNFL